MIINSRPGRTEDLLSVLKRIWVQIWAKSVILMLRRCAPASSKLSDQIDNPFIGDLLVSLMVENSYIRQDFNWFWLHFPHPANLDRKRKTAKMLRRCAPASSKLRDPMVNSCIGDLLIPMFVENSYNWGRLGCCRYCFSGMNRTMYLWDYVDKRLVDCFLSTYFPWNSNPNWF